MLIGRCCYPQRGIGFMGESRSETKRQEVDEALNPGPAAFLVVPNAMFLHGLLLSLKNRTTFHEEKSSHISISACHLNIVRFFELIHRIWPFTHPQACTYSGSSLSRLSMRRSPATSNVSNSHFRQLSFLTPQNTLQKAPPASEC